MKGLYFITVNYNNSEYTLKYIDSVNGQTPPAGNVRIIVVDSNSEIDDYTKLKNGVASAKNVKLIRNDTNLGYFKALNVGICDVTDKRNSLLVISNNDLEFREDFILELNRLEYDSSTLVLAPDVITQDGYHQNAHRVTRVQKWRKLGYTIYFSNY